MSATSPHASATDHVLRDVLDDALKLHGPKRGLWLAAQLLGVTERWLRAWRYGEPARVSAEVYLRALDARRTLRAERRARLIQELREIEAGDDAARVA